MRILLEILQIVEIFQGVHSKEKPTVLEVFEKVGILEIPPVKDPFPENAKGGVSDRPHLSTFCTAPPRPMPSLL